MRFCIPSRRLRGATLATSQQGPTEGTTLVDFAFPHPVCFKVGGATSSAVGQAIFRVRVGRGGVFSEELVPQSIVGEYIGDSVVVDVLQLSAGERASAIVAPVSWPAFWHVCDGWECCHHE